MKVRYIKEGFGHKVGSVIDPTLQVALHLVNNKICEIVEESNKTLMPEVKPEIKKAGRPKKC